MADEEIARTELEVWRLAHRVGTDYIDQLTAEAGVPELVVAGARMYREYVARVMAAAGYSVPAAKDPRATSP